MDFFGGSYFGINPSWVWCLSHCGIISINLISIVFLGWYLLFSGRKDS